MTKINWIEKFVKEQRIKSRNNLFLKNKNLYYIFQDLDEKLTNLFEDKLYLDSFKSFYKNDMLHLDKLISIQKGRITKQIRESNRDSKNLDIALSVIFSKLDKIEKKLFVKENGRANISK